MTAVAGPARARARARADGAAVAVPALMMAVAGVVGLAFSRLSESWESFGGVPPVVPALALGIAGLALFVWERDEPRALLPLALALAAATVAVVVLSTLGVAEVGAIIEVLDAQAGSMALLVSIVVLVTDARRMEAALWGITAATLVVGGVSCVQAATGTYESTYGGLARGHFAAVDDGFGWRLGGPTGDPNFFAQMLVAGVVVATVCGLAASGRARAVAAAAAVVGSVALALTYSRGGALALAAALGLLSIRVLAWRAVAVWATAAVIVVGLAPDALLTRVSTAVTDAPAALAGDPVADSAINGRASEAIVGFRQFSDHWLLGVGAGHYEDRYLDYAGSVGLDPRGIDRSAHSIVIETMAETGVVGLALLVVVVVAALAGAGALRTAGRTARRPELVWMALAVEGALVGHLACALFLHSAYPRGLWILVGLGLAAGQVATRWRGVAPGAARWGPAGAT